MKRTNLFNQKKEYSVLGKKYNLNFKLKILKYII